MKFSILIANYNNGNYFKDCYQSILSQTYSNFEVIIVDDCSTDDSVERIKNLIQNNSKFKIYYNSQNKGCGYTKAKCAELASGDICGFLDPDDSIQPDALSSILEVYKRHPNAAGVYSQFIFCDQKLKPQSINQRNAQVRPHNKYFFNTLNQISHFFTYKNSVYQKTQGINPIYKAAIDQDLYLKIYEAGILYFLKKPLYNYRKHSGGISQGASKNRAYLEFSKIVNDAIARRNIKRINGYNVENKKEHIFAYLNYQNTLYYRVKEKILLKLEKLVRFHY